jgi:AcrR family transcriptional regulator
MRIGAAAHLPAPSASRAPGYAKSVDTRAKILAAALEEASDSGFHSASLAGIAARAGVAIGNLYYHFGSREGLLHELMGSLVADLMARLHAVDADDDSDFFERQRAGMLVYLDYLRANPAYVRLADEIKLHEPGLYRRAVAGWVERMAARIRAGIEQKTLRSMDDAEIAAQAHFLLGARHFLEQMIGQADRPREAAVVDAYIALLRDGLSRKGRSKRGKVPAARKTPGGGGSKTSDAATRRNSGAQKKR